MPNWIVDILGGITSGLAVILIAIWAAIFAKKNESHSEQRKKKTGELSTSNSRISTALLIGVVTLALGSTVFQIVSAFQHHATDTQLVRYYDDKFDNMTQKRMLAAKALQEYMEKGKWKLVTNSTDGLDEVLGFFDTLGEEVKSGSVSAEVAHEYFESDIAAYYQASKEYIAETQTNEGSSVFEFVKPLYDEVEKVEARKSRKSVQDLAWSTSDLKKYLESEANAPNLKDAH